METPKYRIWAEWSIPVPPELCRVGGGLDKLKFYSPSNTSRRDGGLLFSQDIYQWTPTNVSLLRESLLGGHVWCNVLGADSLAVEFFLELVRRTQVPEVAILGVDKLEEVTRVRSSLESAGLWRAPGVPVVAIQSLDHWQEGTMPESYQAEFRGCQVSGVGGDEWMGGLPNVVERSHNYRGCMTLHDGRTKVTFWHVVASKSILGTPLGKKLNLEEGVKAKKVILLEDREQMESLLSELVVFFEEWMDPEVKEAFVERDQALRAMGFPHNPRWGNGSTAMDPDPLVVAEDGKLLPMKDLQNCHPVPRTFDNNFLGGLNPQFFAVLEGQERTPRNWNPRSLCALPGSTRIVRWPRSSIRVVQGAPSGSQGRPLRNGPPKRKRGRAAE
eukprot:jgi/Botrbrau1/20484/Bobra.145_2s0044.1